MSELRPTPNQLGFSLPPEWAPHDATWFAWPHCEETWPGHLREAQTTIARCIVELTRERPHQYLPERAEVLVQSA
ncbi:MAG: agmatine deiminase family protein, partial [Myxococcota bacterium]|nr:agmatine deiminase family protein [Myxococcota bacterium]